jgi:putative transposase
MRAPKANAIADRFVRTVGSECLDWNLILNRRHRERALRMFVDGYKAHRPAPLVESRTTRPVRAELHAVRPTTGEIQRRDRLGGHIREHTLAA